MPIFEVNPLHVAAWATLVVAAIAAMAAVAAIWSDRFFRTRDGLAALLATYEAQGFNTLVWRMEQFTRPASGDAADLDRIDPALKKASFSDDDDGRARLKLMELMLAQDFQVQRAGMHEVYFFALRTHAWLVSSRTGRTRRAKLLNDAFGYQLLSTLLDHRSIALRLQDPGKADDYFPTQYGCLDAAHIDLVNRLANELLERKPSTFPPPPDILHPLREKRTRSDLALETLKVTSA